MSVVPLLLFILVSSLPAFLVFLWFRLGRRRIPGSFPLWLLVGAGSLFLALFLQVAVLELGILPATGSRTGFFLETFVRIAFTEELSRFLVLAPLCLFFRRKGRPEMPGAEAGRAAGLVAGLGFGILESVNYGAGSPLGLFARLFGSIPLHAACGSRVGEVAFTLGEKPGSAVLRFLSAVAVHGTYNILAGTPGNLALIGSILIPLLALATSVQAIAAGRK
ncbi:MAG: PrsW family glutamic-type intramembrane protease [Treponema sp.]|nr:PrsW family glutamic-type intramembrane protease [Treponema sp.]